MITAKERSVIQRLLEVCMHAYHLMDETEDAGDDFLRVDRESFERLSTAMGALDELPDDQPGYTMNESAKARWALRRLLDAATAEQPSCGQDARDADAYAILADYVRSLNVRGSSQMTIDNYELAAIDKRARAAIAAQQRQGG